MVGRRALWHSALTSGTSRIRGVPSGSGVFEDASVPLESD
jgi:hypothetical protein